MAKKVWTENRNQQLIAMYESKKLSTKEMATRLGVTQRTIYNHLHRLHFPTTDLPRRHRAPLKQEFSEEEKKKIRDLHSQGKYITEIADALGRSRTPVRRVFEELGLQSSPFKIVKIGERFGYLTVVGLASPRKNKDGSHGSRCVVRCHCGQEKTVSSFNLRTGNTKSCGCKLHLRNPDTPYIRIFHAYCFGARSRRFEMNLSITQIKHLVHLQCFYCHAGPSNYDKTSKFRYMGIDRVDSAMHYTPGNVLPACSMCNRAKSDASLSSFVAWVNRLGGDLSERDILQGAARIGRTLKELG